MTVLIQKAAEAEASMKLPGEPAEAEKGPGCGQTLRESQHFTAEERRLGLQGNLGETAREVAGFLAGHEKKEIKSVCTPRYEDQGLSRG